MKSVLSLIKVCPACSTSYIPENHESCRCEEPVVQDWESHPYQPDRRENHAARAHADWHINLEGDCV